LEHFVYLPKKATANAQDIPFFLSTRLAEEEETVTRDKPVEDPVKTLNEVEDLTAKLASDFEESMVRYA